MTTSVLAQTVPAGYSISYRIVDSVDNQGEPCAVCQDVDATVEATVYGVVMSEGANLWMAVDCCSACAVTNVAATMDPTADVVVEYVVDQDDDRMHGPDCVCVHPDAR
jgi:hypothetical protein